MPNALEKTHDDLTSCPCVLSLRCRMLASWLSKLLLCFESAAVSMTRACSSVHQVSRWFAYLAGLAGA